MVNKMLKTGFYYLYKAQLNFIYLSSCLYKDVLTIIKKRIKITYMFC
jgi:hypothetical protein